MFWTSWWLLRVIPIELYTLKINFKNFKKDNVYEAKCSISGFPWKDETNERMEFKNRYMSVMSDYYGSSSFLSS